MEMKEWRGGRGRWKGRKWNEGKVEVEGGMVGVKKRVNKGMYEVGENGR